MSDNLYLFANNNEGTAEDLGYYRLYNMEIDGDSEEIKADEINYVDYIEYNKGSVFNTGITYQSGTIVEFKLSKKHEIGGNMFIAFTRNDSVGYRINGHYINSNLQGYDVTQISSNNNVYVYKFGEGSFYNPFFCVGCPNVNNVTDKTCYVEYWKFYQNNTLVGYFKPCLDVNGIPCLYDEVTKQYYYSAQLTTFLCRTTLRDFQPVLDSNGIPCLMDEVNKKYYYDKNRKGFGCEESYKPVSYLQGDGNSWINTGIYANPQYKYEMTFKDTEFKQYENMFGASNNLKEIYLQRYAQSSVIFKYNKSESYIGQQVDFSNKTKAFIDKNSLYFNDIAICSFDTTTSTTAYTLPVLLLCGYYNEQPDMPSDMKLYSFKMWNENNELVFDGIPVLDNNNTPCMYDKVSKQFFYNQGDGEFSYGIEELECPKANYVEYIRGDRNAYINTLDISGMINSEVEVEWKFKLEATNKATGWFGTVGGYNSTPLYARNVYDNTMGNAIHVVFLEPSNNVTIKTEDRHLGVHVMKINKTGLYMDGNLEAELPGTTYYDSYGFVQPFALLGYNYWNGIQGRSWENVLYYVTFKQAGELILDFRPCLDDNGVLCVYEAVNGVYYYNSDTGEFGGHGKSIGYTPIQYIESNGTQYIDTGVVVNNNTYMDIDYRACESKTIALDYFYEAHSTHYYTHKFLCSELNDTIINNSEHELVIDYYGTDGAWKWQGTVASGTTSTIDTSVGTAYISIRFVGTATTNYVNEYTFVLGNSLASKPKNSDAPISLQDCMSIGYLMNDFYIESTYKYKEIDTTVEPNLTASEGATLTLGSTYMSYLSEEELEQATKNGWIIE